MWMGVEQHRNERGVLDEGDNYRTPQGRIILQRFCYSPLTRCMARPPQ